jgi:insertion element IS1 protein InsB
MIQKTISCFKCVDGELIKNGKAASGKQRFLCKSCKRTQIINYTYKAYLSDTNNTIILLTKEGLGIRSTARIYPLVLDCPCSLVLACGEYLLKLEKKS